MFEYETIDVAVAFNRVVAERYGKNVFRGVKKRFRRAPLKQTRVKTGYRQEEAITVGALELKGIRGIFGVGEGPVLFAQVREDFEREVGDLFDAVQKQLDTASIYKGKAITATREFLDLSGVSMDGIIYSDKVLQDLKDNVWTLIEQPEVCISAGIKIRRKVLFSGKYGTGKTVAAMLTGQKAVNSGWTFIYLEPTAGIESAAVNFVLELARKYQRAVVLIEDVDREQGRGDPYVIGQIMASIDGVMSKNGEVLVVMTTNHLDKLTGGIQRPGRIDKTINFSRFGGTDTERLLKVIIPAEYLSPDIDWSNVAKACDDYAPAFVSGVGTSAKLAAISRTQDSRPMVTEELLIEVAMDLHEQHKACSLEQPGFRA